MTAGWLLVILWALTLTGFVGVLALIRTLTRPNDWADVERNQHHRTMRALEGARS